MVNIGLALLQCSVEMGIFLVIFSDLSYYCTCYLPILNTTYFPLFQVDLLQSLEDQGPYDLIIHKLTDVITRAQDGDNKAKQMMSNLQVRN